MNILAIDAATSILSLTLMRDKEYFEYNADRGFRHSELIMPAVDYLFEQAEMKPGDLDLVCTALGPGSFTGLRVGMATAKGICAGTDTPFVAVPTLDVLARPFTLFDGLTVPLIDARKKRFFLRPLPARRSADFLRGLDSGRDSGADRQFVGEGRAGNPHGSGQWHVY